MQRLPRVLLVAATSAAFAGCASTDTLDPAAELGGGSGSSAGAATAGAGGSQGGSSGAASAGSAGTGSAGTAGTAGTGTDTGGTAGAGASSGGAAGIGGTAGATGGTGAVAGTAATGGTASGGTGSWPPGSCQSDADCAGSPDGAVCDTTLGECVECLPGEEAACLPDEHCDAASRLCEPGCDEDADCQGGSTCTARICNVALGQCAGCCTDADCPDAEHASTSCQAGACLLACDAGFGDCNAETYDGCEAELLGDWENCGACGNECPDRPNALAACVGGVCGVDCDNSHADCDGNAVNGCEVSLNDEQHCGGCNVVCSGAHASSSCLSGECHIWLCDLGWEDCDADGSNGCEIEVRTDPKNCGSCGNVCPGGCSNYDCE
jgi:hypothetical protein